MPPEPRPPLPITGSTPLRVGPESLHAAALRIVSPHAPNRELAARRFIAAAPAHGIDLSFIWLVPGPSRAGKPTALQTCLCVPGHGRTAMLFVSEPEAQPEPASAHAARVACVQAAYAYLSEHRAGAIALAQALPSAHESWALRAFEDAGFRSVATLSYLRVPLPHPAQETPAPALPADVELVPLDALARARGVRPTDQGCLNELVRALDRSYIDTLDCPELCGLRATPDILQSHLKTGIFDPTLWFLLFHQGRPEGCMLLSRVPDHQCVELVYLGLGPELRGKGLGATLLQRGLQRLRGVPEAELNCAVDQRNAAAVRLYARFGFTAFSERVALVKPV